MRRSIGYVIQETGLFPHFDAERNIGTVLEIEGRPKQEIAERTRQLFGQVGLDYATFARRLPYQLSGGQRQRVGLARALAAEPKLLLMDEPFGALDPLTRAEMQDMLRALLKRLNKTVLLVTHDLDEALYLASHIVLLEGGKVVADLPAKEFLGSQIPAVQSYVRAVHRGTGRKTNVRLLSPARIGDRRTHPGASVADRVGHVAGRRHRRADRHMADAASAMGQAGAWEW